MSTTTASAEAPSAVAPAPGELEFVRLFVNSRDVEAGTDRFRDQATWTAWTAGHGLDAAADPDEIAFARDLREALREALLANHDHGALPQRAARLLTDAARRAEAEVSFDTAGLNLTTGSHGFAAVLGRLITAAAAAMGDGTWARLKVCRNDACQWAFYDRSRSRTGQWCSMAICGNRAKQSRWREQRQGRG